MAGKKSSYSKCIGFHRKAGKTMKQSHKACKSAIKGTSKAAGKGPCVYFKGRCHKRKD